MNNKRRLKKPIKIIIGLVAIAIISVVTYMVINSNNDLVMDDNSNFTYVNDYIFDDYYPVVSTDDDKIIRPYNAEKISLYRSFYEKDDEEKDQEKSIVLSDGTYIQNTGVDYSSDTAFDVIAAYTGTVSNITTDTLLGTTVEIKSDNNLTITYQSLSNVTVKKGDMVKQGDVIAKSGQCTINKDIKNSLHVEMYLNGQVINPEKAYEKNLKEMIKEQ